MFFCFQTYLSYWLKNVTLNDVHRIVFSKLCEGKELEKFIEHIPSFVAEKIGSMLYAPAVAELQKWKHQGKKIILLSSSPDFLVKAIAKTLGIHEGFGTQYLVDSKGVLTELGFLLDGSRKADMLKNAVDEHDITMAYSDHVWDLPFLESVSHPVVVNPERRLKKIARRRGWKIL